MDEILKYRLLNSAPEAVYDVLRTHYEYLSWTRGYIEDIDNHLQKKFIQYEYQNIYFDNLELELLHLSIPLINLALAQFGSNKKVLNTLFYDKKIDAYRKACLSNFNFVDDTWSIFFTKEDLEAALNDLEKLICSLDNFETTMLLENPGLSSLIIKKLYSRKGFFANLSQSDWERLIKVSSKNYSISRVVSSHRMLSDRSCYKEAWELLNTVRVDPDMASALYLILKDTDVPYNSPCEMWLKKWVSHQSIEDKEAQIESEVFTGSKHIDEDNHYFLPLRVLIVRSSRIEYNPHDKAVRCADYTNFICENLYEFEKCYKEDDYLFLEYFCLNESLSESSFDVLNALEEKVADDTKLYRMMNKTLLMGKTLQDKAVTLIKIDKYLKEQKDVFQEIKSTATGFAYLIIFIIVAGLTFSGIRYILREIFQII